MTTGLFLLRAKQLHLTLNELDQLDFGMVQDMFIEAGNDNYDYKQVASQADFDAF